MASERILIVEDEKIIALDLKRRLVKFGYQVVGLATTAQEALDQAQEQQPDLILMDIMLAGEQDGVDAAIEIKKQFGFPVIFLTAYADERTLERAKEAEPFGYILKPFKERELHTTIDIAMYKSNVDKKLKEQQRWLSAILNSIGDCIIATDQEDRIVFMNPIAERMTGWTEDEAHNQKIEDTLTLLHEGSEEVVDLSQVEIPPGLGESAYFSKSIIQDRNNRHYHVEGVMSHIFGEREEVDGKVLAFRDITELKHMHDQITYQASHDLLTGLVNRAQFAHLLEESINASKTSGSSHAVIYLDLDQFKIINDTCGHLAGDELLIEISELVKKTVRSTDICSRLGGDEFAILLEQSDLDLAIAKAEVFKNLLDSYRFTWEEKIYSVTASIGIVPINETSSDTQEILAAADDACYLAKAEGGGKIKVYETSAKAFMKRRGEMDWVSRLNLTLEEDRFVLFYQTIEALQKGNTSKKAEILIRLEDEEGEIISPAHFLPAAERYNIMPQIDRWVIKNALSQLAEADDEVIYSLNLSGTSLADETLFSYIKKTFGETGADPARFCFEITETTAIENMSRAIQLMKDLKELGCTFALDDFGRGFSSFEYLSSLPVNFLKLDGSYVKDIVENPTSRALVESINSIGHTMGLQTIAEFVSSEEIKNIITEMGVDYAQGYVVMKPAPLNDR
ncbi:MAG: EAL domain-containing protein [Spirochaetales bacterium]|nr:EAL domain-containing protein [Spirochaetales bacterium]MCF7938726.1 EAL domain-containing protein [Spirochaetales bacterium]